MNTLTLAHYYTTPDVQAMADYVGDSLELALIARREKAQRIVFAGVQFMAETTKIINPDAEVILPDAAATCSLVTQTDMAALRAWRERYADHVHVSYINSSAEHKTISDWIVTSRNVDEIIASIYAAGKKVIFSPDRNMGAWLNYQYGYQMPVWNAVCEVHDKFKEEQIEYMLTSANGKAWLLAHPESPLPVLKRADMVGSTKQMLDWIEKFSGATEVIYVATEEGLLHNMRQLRTDLNIQQAPIYSGCQCNACPYMKRNTVDLVRQAQMGKGFVIDYLTEETMDQARKPVERMLSFSQPKRNAA
ncbi:MAG: quinolinate synthase NadA [Gammaproteobacteria bacterium]|nr:quinolinate synthase NadA [Gammaproteobacteria bacterium]MDH5652016.1 quinolinate synthase NadA [Gammaproteobacteria bacterium]